jgi:hypothetical protein
MALVQMTNPEFDPNAMSPERAAILESIFLERREYQRRGCMPRELREPGAAASLTAVPPVRASGLDAAEPERPAPVEAKMPAGNKSKRLSVERRLSLEEMARAITGKRRRKP